MARVTDSVPRNRGARFAQTSVRHPPMLPTLSPPRLGESPGGISPPGARRTGRDSLPSSGSHRPAVGARADPPVGEQAGFASVDLGEQPACRGGAAAQPLVFPAGPTNEVSVDPSEKPGQLRAVEAPVVADPAPHDRVDRSRESGEGRARTRMQAPAADLPPEALACVV